MPQRGLGATRDAFRREARSEGVAARIHQIDTTGLCGLQRAWCLFPTTQANAVSPSNGRQGREHAHRQKVSHNILRQGDDTRTPLLFSVV